MLLSDLPSSLSSAGKDIRRFVCVVRWGGKGRGGEGREEGGDSRKAERAFAELVSLVLSVCLSPSPVHTFTYVPVL